MQGKWGVQIKILLGINMAVQVVSSVSNCRGLDKLEIWIATIFSPELSGSQECVLEGLIYTNHNSHEIPKKLILYMRSV